MSTRKVRADLDGHLRTSSHISPEYAKRVIQTATSRLGQGGVLGVLRYNPQDGIDRRWDDLVKNIRGDMITTDNGRYLPESDLLLVHGQEIKVREGYEVLAIGTLETENIPHNLSARATAGLIRQHGGYSVIAAPYHANGMLYVGKFDPEVIRYFDAIEVFSGEAASRFFGKFPNANEKASGFYSERRKIEEHLDRFVGTDNHSLGEIGRTYATIEMPLDYSQFMRRPGLLTAKLREGLKEASDQGRFSTTPNPRGAYRHAFDLLILGLAKKFLGWDGNTKTAPLLERLGIIV